MRDVERDTGVRRDTLRVGYGSAAFVEYPQILL